MAITFNFVLRNYIEFFIFFCKGNKSKSMQEYYPYTTDKHINVNEKNTYFSWNICWLKLFTYSV